MSHQPIILASASPRREELLRSIGLNFLVIPAQEKEEELRGNPKVLAPDRALIKARQVASLVNKGLVIGADTIVSYKGKIFGKPKDGEEARRHLEFLSGKSHHVTTGVAVVDAGSGQEEVSFEVTKVWMKALTSKEMEAYILTGEPFDKAGGYAIQGFGGLLIERINGSYSNVVGLPLGKLRELLLRFGLDLLGAKTFPP